MNGEFLLDTNVVIRLFAHDLAVKRQFDANPDVLLPIFVLGELYYGAQKSALAQANCERIDKFAARIIVLTGDVATAYEFGRIKNELRLKGRMIPENDLWIAALARQYDLILVSGDRHFAEVDNLRWESWSPMRSRRDAELARIRETKVRISEAFYHDPELMVEHYIELQRRHGDRLVYSTESRSAGVPEDAREAGGSEEDSQAMP